MTFEQARNFCGAITEFAINLGKRNFLLVGEVAGGDTVADRYLQAVGRNLDAALDIGEQRLALRDLGRGLAGPRDYFAGFVPGSAPLGSHRELGDKVLTVLDDHDHVFGEKLRFASRAANDHQAAAATAIQLLTLGIPVPVLRHRAGLRRAGGAGAAVAAGLGEPRPLPARGDVRSAVSAAGGRAGVPGVAAGRRADHDLPGFGPFGTAGAHCFDPSHPIYVRVAAIAGVAPGFRCSAPGVSTCGRISVFGETVRRLGGRGDLLAWSRILVDEEALCVVNPNGVAPARRRRRGRRRTQPARFVADGALNTAEAAGLPSGTGGRRPAAGAAPTRRHRVRGGPRPRPQRGPGADQSALS